MASNGYYLSTGIKRLGGILILFTLSHDDDSDAVHNDHFKKRKLWMLHCVHAPLLHYWSEEPHLPSGGDN